MLIKQRKSNLCQLISFQRLPHWKRALDNIVQNDTKIEKIYIKLTTNLYNCITRTRPNKFITTTTTHNKNIKKKLNPQPTFELFPEDLNMGFRGWLGAMPPDAAELNTTFWADPALRFG
jgi:hypothetical protein